MKKFILNILLFGGIVAIIDVCFGKTCEWLLVHAKGGDLKSFHQAAIIQTSDILIMGSSRAHHHYSSSVINEVTGKTVYNAGFDGNGIVLASGLYEMVSERYIPKIIVYEVTPEFDFNIYRDDDNNNRYLGHLRPYYRNKKIREYISQINPIERYKNLSTMFRYNSKFIDLLKDQFIVGEFTADGYAPLNGRMTTDFIKKQSDDETQVDPMKIRIMEDFIQRVTKTDSKLVFVISPRYGADNSSSFNPIKDLCSKYNVEVWDYYNDNQFQNIDFFNEPVHLNDDGAQRYSYVIATYLNQLY